MSEFLVLAVIAVVVFGAMGAALAWRRSQQREQRDVFADSEHVKAAREFDEQSHRD